MSPGQYSGNTRKGLWEHVMKASILGQSEGKSLPSTVPVTSPSSHANTHMDPHRPKSGVMLSDSYHRARPQHRQQPFVPMIAP
ncbi:hypothetical protein SRHO_G00206720 [Serrasalmus rhombeus]